tara:strand:- start:3152 stop:4246 length:1095 start_codon:yes stop_codon:yes gene_type:complete
VASAGAGTDVTAGPESDHDGLHLDADLLETLGARLLSAAGMSDHSARSVSKHVVGNSLLGVDSHGIVRFPQYLELISAGSIDPAAEAVVVTDQPAFTRIDGQAGHGVPAMIRLAEYTANKARSAGMATGALINCGHTGRIGAYAETIARQGCFALIIGGGGHTRGNPKVAPYGGREGIMGTNPYTLALPGGPTGAVVVDFATSTIAQGKLLAASKTRTPLPPGMILDRAGRPSTDAADYYAGGVLLPAAGPKGYGLGLIGELLAHGVLGQSRALNWLVVALDLTTLSDGGDFQTRIDDYLSWVKSRDPADGFDEILIPGEPEYRCREVRQHLGIPVAEEIWEEILGWAERSGVEWDGLPKGPLQ